MLPNSLPSTSEEVLEYRLGGIAVPLRRYWICSGLATRFTPYSDNFLSFNSLTDFTDFTDLSLARLWEE